LQTQAKFSTVYRELVHSLVSMLTLNVNQLNSYFFTTFFNKLTTNRLNIQKRLLVDALIFPQKVDCSVAGENFYAAPAPTLLYSRSKFLKVIKVDIRSDILFSSDSV
jgi:hypothetical protein